MLQTFLELDKQLFLWLNQFHNPVFDEIMFFISRTDVWLPLYAVLVVLIYLKYKRLTIRVLILVTLVIVSADSFTSKVMKPYFQRFRPSHEPSINRQVHIVYGYKGGIYGFASSHAANTFGLAMVMCLLFNTQIKHYRWLFLWAFVVSYSRIYLGVHYPLDVLAGAAVGILSATIWFYIFNRFVFKGLLS